MKSLGILALVLVIGLAACSKGGKTISTSQGSISTSADDKTTTITTKDGSMTAGQNAVDLSKLGVPIYPGVQQQQGSFAISGQQGSGQLVTFKSTDGFDKIITVIMTDGEENSSREWTLQAIRELIRSKEAAGNWTFVFLGANLDAFAQGTSLGVPMANAVRFDPANYRGVYASLAKSTNVFSAGAARAAGDFFKGEAAGIKKS